MTQLLSPGVPLKPRTPEERTRILDVLDRVDRHREELLAANDGQLFPSSGEILSELRDEREHGLP